MKLSDDLYRKLWSLHRGSVLKRGGKHITPEWTEDVHKCGLCLYSYKIKYGSHPYCLWMEQNMRPPCVGGEYFTTIDNVLGGD